VVKVIYEISRENRKKIITIVLTFYLLMRAFFCPGDCGVYHCSLCLLVSESYSKTQLSSPVMTRLRKSGSVSSRLSISADTSDLLEPSLNTLLSYSNLV
jgi:hypothetical protein